MVITAPSKLLERITTLLRSVSVLLEVETTFPLNGINSPTVRFTSFPTLCANRAGTDAGLKLIFSGNDVKSFGLFMSGSLTRAVWAKLMTLQSIAMHSAVVRRFFILHFYR